MLSLSDIFDAHMEAVNVLRRQEDRIHGLGLILLDHLQRGKRIFLCGNGGSAADAQHIAAELVCRFQDTRKALPAIALTTDTSALTAIGNDFGFKQIYARQIDALGQSGDLLIAISTSGASENVIAAVHQAKQQGLTTLGLLGRDGGEMATLVDHPLIVAAGETARIQECHILIGHIWCAMVDAAYTGT